MTTNQSTEPRSSFPQSECVLKLCPFGKEFEPAISECVGARCAAWAVTGHAELRDGKPDFFGRCAR